MPHSSYYLLSANESRKQEPFCFLPKVSGVQVDALKADDGTGGLLSVSLLLPEAPRTRSIPGLKAKIRTPPLCDFSTPPLAEARHQSWAVLSRLSRSSLKEVGSGKQKEFLVVPLKLCGLL